MEIYLNLFLITVIVVNLVDISGVVQSFEGWLAKWLDVKEVHMKIIECSYCLNHHISLFYLLITCQWSLEVYTFVFIMSLLTEQIKYLCLNVKDLIQYTIDLTQKITNR